MLQSDIKEKIGSSAPDHLLEITIFYDKASIQSGDLDKILIGLSQLETLGVRISIQEKELLSKDQMEKAVEEIRRIKPQSRGSVVASGGRVLPISGSKKLNLRNTPVLLVGENYGEADSRPIYVFPCKVGERYYSVLEGIAFLSSTYPDFKELPGETEESLISSLKANSGRLESGLTFRSSEDTLTTGKTDLVFVDSRSQILLVEVEREATDSAIGQILRLAAGYERDYSVSRVRCGIACFRINRNVLAAAQRGGIEVWQAQDSEKFLKLT
ncbi:MAG TPA: hypothetical protein VED17_09380 [Nitrososphaerales archaeon]|nr:hypothetical protein [Nitrososphaerales archaeon]